MPCISDEEERRRRGAAEKEEVMIQRGRECERNVPPSPPGRFIRVGSFRMTPGVCDMMFFDMYDNIPVPGPGLQ